MQTDTETVDAHVQPLRPQIARFVVDSASDEETDTVDIGDWSRTQVVVVPGESAVLIRRADNSPPEAYQGTPDQIAQAAQEIIHDDAEHHAKTEGWPTVDYDPADVIDGWLDESGSFEWPRHVFAVVKPDTDE